MALGSEGNTTTGGARIMGQGQGSEHDDIDLDDTNDDGSGGEEPTDGDTGGDTGGQTDPDTGQGQPAARPPVPRPAPPRAQPKPADRAPTWEEYEELRAKLETQIRSGRLAAKEAKERKEALRKLQLESASEQERREAELADRTRAETEGAWRPRVITAEARAALAAAGCQDVARLVKLVDRDQVAVDDDGTVTGLDEQVQALRKDYPEAFRVRRTAPAGGPQPQPADDGIVNPGPGRAPGKKLTASERQALTLTGRRPS